jgi:transcriptional regulator with XRE-family HTH domain
MSDPTPWSTLFRKREAAGLTRADIARKTGYSVTYLGLLERGLKTNPTKPVVCALANAIGCTVAELDDTTTTEDAAGITIEILASQLAEFGEALNALRANMAAA